MKVMQSVVEDYGYSKLFKHHATYFIISAQNLYKNLFFYSSNSFYKMWTNS